MKLIPANINESSPYGEKRIFQILKSEYKNSMSNWLVYHSLNYPVEIEKKNKTSYLYFGETDFLVFIPNKGLINIEITSSNAGPEGTRTNTFFGLEIDSINL